jgi:putative flippase GtrA
MSAQSLILRIPVTFWRFGLIGAAGLFVDLAALYAAIWGLGLSPLPAKVFSFLAAATFTWGMNRRYTFEASGKSILREWTGFLSANAVGGAVNFAAYTLIVTRTPLFFWLPALATAAGSLSGLLFNYLASRHYVFKPKAALADSREDAPPLPSLAYPLTLLASLAFGGVALWLGMDANWDLRNYHWYNGWAFIHGMVDRNPLVSQTPSFYNPTLDAPYAWAAERLPGRVVGYALGMLHGLNFLPLFAIAWRLSALSDPRLRFFASAAIALAGIVGAGGVSEVGTVFYDDALSLFVSLSALLVVSRWETLASGRVRDCAGYALAAGLPVGLAFGLKQPMAIYCVGLCAAFLFSDLPWPRRVWAGFCFGLGALLGFAVGGGHWLWHLWQAYGNPLFPYFNHVFRSPWGLPIPYRDDAYVPLTWTGKLSLIFRFPFDTRLVGETDFRDFRLLALAVLTPLAALAWLWRKPSASFVRPGPGRWLLVAGLLTYAVWTPLFSVYRYLVPLEMLAPLLIVALVGWLPFGEKTRGYAATGILGFVAFTTVPGDWLRAPWEERAIPVQAPAISQPEETVVLLSGYEPLSYLIPAFPKTVRFFRIHGNFALPEAPDSGFRAMILDAIHHNQGPIAALHRVTEQANAEEKLAGFGLALDQASCRPMNSPLAVGVGVGETGEDAYAFCLARRLADSPYRSAATANPPLRTP